MSDRKALPGKFVWFELMSNDAQGERAKAQAFYGEVLGWRVVPFPMGGSSYEMIYVGDTMIGGYAANKDPRRPARWLSYVSVEDVDAGAQAAVANGGQLLTPPTDIPTVGRTARIADPQGAELCLFKSANGDPADAPVAPHGTWVWNELHTTDPASALAFYQKVVGLSHRSVEMGPGGTYHILSKGSVERGGATSHLPGGAAPHWLPYVAVDDPDAAVARAQRMGATIPFGPEDIPGVGRLAGLQDPTGARLAILRPLPRDKPPV